MARLRAAGEDTHDLLINLLEALKQAPNHHFQRWLNTRIDLWSTKQIDWQPDGSDLMQEAEGYYLELKTKNMWSRRTDGSLYINSAELEDQGDLSDYLGVNIERRKDGKIEMTQPTLTLSILKDVGLWENGKKYEPRVNNVAEGDEKPVDKAEPEYEDAHVGAVANLNPYHHLNW